VAGSGRCSMATRKQEESAATDKPVQCVVCGVASGLLVTALLNPWDRALYLSIVNQRPFLASRNWTSPYRGVSQTLVQRSITSGIYFPVEDYFTHVLGLRLLAGPATGIVIGIVLNPLSLIKYHTWGTDSRTSFCDMALQLQRNAGVRVFLRGSLMTCMRDSMFGLCFCLRKHIEDKIDDKNVSPILSGCLCATLGTVLGSPFNFLRNLMYAQKSSVPLETSSSKFRFVKENLHILYCETKRQATAVHQFRYLCQRFGLGWGTARVAVGMALADRVYHSCCIQLQMNTK